MLSRLLLALSITTTLVAAQSPIDFEAVPGGMPSDGLAISNQFEVSHGVTFSLADGSSPVLAQVGPPETAFQGSGLLPDQPDASAGAGQFFLTDDGTLAGIPEELVITYTSPVAAASGVILDIDGAEEWTIEAFDGAGALLDSVVLGPNNTVDGSATTWSFQPGAAVIAEIRISFSGFTPSNLVGLAFDNFSATSVTPNVGQANSAEACLMVNGVGSGTGNGPYPVVLSPTDDLDLDWSGPAGAPFILAAGPLNPGAAVVPCFGSFDLGTAPFFNNVLILLDGTTIPGSVLYTLDAAGSASQSYSLPNPPPGLLIAVQGVVFQPGGMPCGAVFTAAFQIGIQ